MSTSAPVTAAPTQANQNTNQNTQAAAPPPAASPGRADVHAQVRGAETLAQQEQILRPAENAAPSGGAAAPPQRVYRAIREYTDPHTGNFIVLPSGSPIVITPNLNDPVNANYDHARAFEARGVRPHDCASQPLVDPTNGNWIYLPRFASNDFVWAKKEGDPQPMLYRRPPVRPLSQRIRIPAPPETLTSFAAQCRGLTGDNVQALRPANLDPAIQDLLGERTMNEVQDYHLKLHTAPDAEKPQWARMLVDLLKPQADAIQREAERLRFGTIDYATRDGESHNGRALRLNAEISNDTVEAMAIYLRNLNRTIVNRAEMPQPLQSVCEHNRNVRTADDALEALRRALEIRSQEMESPAHARSAEAARINASNHAMAVSRARDAEYEAERRFFDAIGVRSRTNRGGEHGFTTEQAMGQWNQMLEAKRTLDAAIAAGRLDHLSPVEIEARYVELRGHLPHAADAIERDMRHWGQTAHEQRSAQRNVHAANQQNRSARARRDEGARRLQNAQAALDAARATDIPCIAEAANDLQALVNQSQAYRNSGAQGMDAAREREALQAGIATAEGVLSSARGAIGELGGYVAQGNQELTDFRAINGAGMSHVQRAGSLSQRALAGVSRVDSFLDILEASPFAHGYRAEIATARERNNTIRQQAQSAYATSQSLRHDLQSQQVQAAETQAGLDAQAQRRDAAQGEADQLDGYIQNEAQAELAAITVKEKEEQTALEGSLSIESADDFDSAVAGAIEMMVGKEPGSKTSVNLKVAFPIAGVDAFIEVAGSAERLEGGGMKITLQLGVGGELDLKLVELGVKITGTLEGSGDSAEEALRLLLLPLAAELEAAGGLAGELGEVLFGEGFVADLRANMDDDDFGRGAIGIDVYAQLGDPDTLGAKVNAGAEIGKKYERSGNSTYTEERLSAEVTAGPLAFATEWKRTRPETGPVETELAVKGKIDVGVAPAQVIAGLTEAVQGRIPNFNAATLASQLANMPVPGLDTGGAVQVQLTLKEKDGKVEAELSFATITEFKVDAGVVSAGFANEQRLGTIKIGEGGDAAAQAATPAAAA